MYQRVRWAEHEAYMDQRPPKGWQQGDHMLIIGPTGSGKTTLADKIAGVRIRRDGTVIMPITKARDKTLTDPGQSVNLHNFKILREWSPRKSDEARQAYLWPRRTPGMDPDAFLAVQRRNFRAMFSDIQDRGKRTVIVDEMHMMSDPHFIGIGKEIALAFHQGRSDNVTMVALTQRPAWIPRIVYPSVSHVYMANTGEIDDLKPIAKLGRGDWKQVLETVQSLPNHDWLYLNPTGDTPPHIVNIKQ